MWINGLKTIQVAGQQCHRHTRVVGGAPSVVLGAYLLNAASCCRSIPERLIVACHSSIIVNWYASLQISTGHRTFVQQIWGYISFSLLFLSDQRGCMSGQTLSLAWHMTGLYREKLFAGLGTWVISKWHPHQCDMCKVVDCERVTLAATSLCLDVDVWHSSLRHLILSSSCWWVKKNDYCFLLISSGKWGLLKYSQWYPSCEIPSQTSNILSEV